MKPDKVYLSQRYETQNYLLEIVVVQVNIGRQGKWAEGPSNRFKTTHIDP